MTRCGKVLDMMKNPGRYLTILAAGAVAAAVAITAILLIGTPLIPSLHAGGRVRAARYESTPENATVAMPRAAVAEPFPVPPQLQGLDLLGQTPEEASAKSHGCVRCHAGARDPHFKETVQLGCIDCHGGNPNAPDMVTAHVWPACPDEWKGSANPVRSYTLLNRETPEFIRFVNPGDLRVAHLSCGTVNCHGGETLQVRKSMMTHGCMLWGAALYNNGAVPHKRPRFGESYSMCGAPQRLQTVPPPTEQEMLHKGIL